MTVSGTALACRELRLRRFRNFPELDLSFPAAGVAVIGNNGSGKTNLLEALYYLEIFRSFRGAPDEQLTRFGSDAFYLRGVFQEVGSGREREITAAYEPRTGRKRVTIDGVEPDRLGEAIGQVGAVVFSPGDVSLVAGSPGERRRFLDIVLSLNVPGYLEALQRYRQVLRQRNALLRAGTTGPALSAWNDGLVAWGSRIVAARAAWVEAHAASFANRFAEIGGSPPACLGYRPGLHLDEGASLSVDAAARALDEAICRAEPRERERRLTLAGPHRDDLAMTANGPDGEIDLRDFGSGGQLRTAAIALRLVEAETIRAARGRPPLILLDDVFAELDPGRSRRVLDTLVAQERGQVVVTAPKESDLGLGHD
ncbi:MAG: DNA replication/repair protein RecF, partial [Candidatus Rokuibacteriota bacterium]